MSQIFFFRYYFLQILFVILCFYNFKEKHAQMCQRICVTAVLSPAMFDIGVLNLYFPSGEGKVRGYDQKATIFHELFMNEASYKNVASDTRSSILISVFIKDSCWAPAAHVITFAKLHSRDIELQAKAGENWQGTALISLFSTSSRLSGHFAPSAVKSH